MTTAVDTTSQTDATSPQTTASSVANLLSPLVIELTTLAVNGKQAHWHIKGGNFVPVHELLDTIVDNARQWSDMAAERAVALGVPIDATLPTVAARTNAPNFPQGFISADTAIENILPLIDSVIITARQSLEPLGQLDEPSQDLVIEVLRGIEKDRWFLSSSYSKQ